MRQQQFQSGVFILKIMTVFSLISDQVLPPEITYGFRMKATNLDHPSYVFEIKRP